MKKTQFKDAIRNISKRKVSFMSLCLVVMLGLGALLITRYMGAGIEENISSYYEDRNFKDYEMISSLGVTDASLDKIRQTDKVTAAEGVIQADGSVLHDGKKSAVTVISLTDSVSVPEVVEGRLPEGRKECMIGEDFAEISGLRTGDVISINMNGMSSDDGDSPLYSKEFTITGLMMHPDYFRRKAVNTVTLPLEAFNKDVTDGLYTRAFIRIEEPEGVSLFTDTFFEETADVTASLKALEEELGEDRTREIKDEANARIDEEWAEAEKQLSDAEDEITAGEEELAARLEDGRNDLNNAQDKLDKRLAKYYKQIADGKRKLKEYKEKLALVEKNLPAIKKYIREMRDKYDGELEDTLTKLAAAEKMLDGLDKIADKDSEEYQEQVRELAGFVRENSDSITQVHDFFASRKVMNAAEKIRDVTDGRADATAAVRDMAKFDTDGLIEQAGRIEQGGTEGAEEFVENTRQYVEELQACRDKYEQMDSLVSEYEANRETINKGLADKEKELKDYEKKLAAEKKKYQQQIDAGWSTYYAEKAKYESKLEEAKMLLAENREEALKKLDEAREEVDKIEPCRWITLDRRTNAGYVDAISNLDAIRSAGNVFGILFMIVTAIVCLSTLVIIIDEQKTLVGTAKAFGFSKREVLGKYLVFGVSAAVLGCILSTIGAYIMAEIVQRMYAASGMYPIGVSKSIVTPWITCAAALIIFAVTVASTIAACVDIMRSPASVLMKGTVLRKNAKNKKKESSGRGSLYSRLIVRNMIEDKARVIVTTAIIAFCCMLMGMGISMKLAYDGMAVRQVNEVNKYDFILSLSDEVTDKEKASLVRVLENNSASYLGADTESVLYRWDDQLNGLQLICADPAKLQDYYAVCDPETGEPLEIPEDGILIQKRMNESYGMNEGDSLTLLDTSLKQHDAVIRGQFTNYVGRTVIASPEAYKSIFGKDYETNSYYVLLNGADDTRLRSELLAVSDNISFTDRDECISKFESVAGLYNIVVVIVTGLAILISFMILTNLSNIFLNRRKKELSIMRINGFSVRQAKGYLRKESVITTTAGLVLGVLMGAALTPYVISLMQQPDLEFVKSFHPAAWIAAVLLEAVFAIVINAFVFRKVSKLNFRDIMEA